ncbi:MAG: methyltransferase domain-containing protein [Patescibacteria group bacterium]|jgi:cyclopropane fatty-acyl-phospholipid synthase-like methyltransferase
MAKTHQEIVDYYNATESDYRLFLAGEAGGLHFGFWPRGVWTLPKAILRENEELARRAKIVTSDFVLDAGCGIGGSSHYLAREIGCRTVGITLVPHQAEEARRRARKQRISKRCQFLVGDYLRTPFAASTFDVVWGIESVCYALNKLDFFREAFRVLKPGGRLIIADALTPRPTRTLIEDFMVRTWVGCWGVEQVDSVSHFLASARRAGFENVVAEDVTDLIVPTVQRQFALSIPGVPTSILLEMVGLRNRLQTWNAVGAFTGYVSLLRGDWGYYIVTASKPA